jgi:dienelactone hydrolase
MSPRPVPPPRSTRRVFPSSPAVIALAAVLILAAAGRARAAEERPPVFTITPDTIRADTTGVWRASLRIQNHGEWGLYPDSLSLEWRNLDDEPNAAPRQGTTPLTALIRAMEPASAGESNGLEWSAPADFERGTLTFRFHLHDAKKRPFTLQSTVVVAGNDQFDRHPRVLLDAGGAKVEVVDVPAPGPGPVPGVLYVPPAGVSARMTLRWASQLARRGHTVSIVSLPGTGGSTGTPDRAGPASVAAVEAALAHLTRVPGVDGRRLAVWGLGDGGTTALLTAARHPGLAGVIAQNAEYDPWRAYRELPAAGRAAFVRAVGADSAGWRARSAALVATKVTAPVLILHTAGMPAWSVATAEAFMMARAARDLPGESRIEGGTSPASAGAGPRRDATRLAIDFLTRRFREQP